jgi:hypothetical protein
MLHLSKATYVLFKAATQVKRRSPCHLNTGRGHSFIGGQSAYTSGVSGRWIEPYRTGQHAEMCRRAGHDFAVRIDRSRAPSFDEDFLPYRSHLRLSGHADRF